MTYMHYIRVGNERQLLKDKTAVAYIRTCREISSEELEAQRKKIMDYAEANSIKIKYVYEDLGVPAFKYYQKGLVELYNKVYNDKIDFVLVTDLARISRNIEHFKSFEEKLWRIGTHILPISTTKEMTI